ncbi:hypothetical protein F2P56_022560 [Juglans regia]|uniref:DUF659 domain-containing protein n=2 Tax=Juglans regia TaxID=51240 RepID=A0A833U881_JUGRE|nr:uncharacterized protein LOC109005765 [Juglans regia]KAF5458537.1 hypothetical protein F2P56_022560 [Juglans regia]
MFLKSIDTSGLRKDSETLFDIFDKVVQEVGVENLVQFITDNDASYKAAGKKLQQKYDSFYWSPCAAHCIDLMLENFSDPRHFPVINETIKKARKITKFIYNHAWVLALMRKDFTKGRDLCRPAQGKEIVEIVLEDREFWAQCQFIVKISEPLVRVLRLVDGEEKPAMGYLYDAMERAKGNIKARCNNKVSVFNPFIRIIDARWDKQLHSPLHAAGCFLNPAIYYNPCFKNKNDVARGFMACVMMIELDIDNQDKIIEKLELYKNAEGDFGHFLAIRQRDKINPVAWWTNFGHEVPTFQKFAIREYKKGRDALDPINLENIDLMEEWVSEDSELIDGEDLDWLLDLGNGDKRVSSFGCFAFLDFDLNPTKEC